jgi:uncharacterized protein (TIGR03790 family)
MAKNRSASWEIKKRWIALLLSAAALVTQAAGAAEAQATASGVPSGASSALPATVMPVPRIRGRLTSKDIGLVINTADPYSVEVGEFYIAQRKLSPSQVLRLSLPVRSTLTPDEFDRLRSAIDSRFDGTTQALALAWSMPYAVSCNALTGALALGFDPGLCGDSSLTCAPSRISPYFNARTSRPYSDLKLRPAMMLAAKNVEEAKRMIERGVRSDRSLGLRGAPPVHAYFVVTSDRARSSRAPFFPPAGVLRQRGVTVHVEHAQALHDVDRVLIYETGATHVAQLGSVGFVDGALADHLTSFGGLLDGKSSQMSALEWISAGATASYGTVSEPCAHPQKFPHPQVLLLTYVQGATAIEAYWKSVAWPLQGAFIGEPLAAPFAKTP